MFKEVKANKRSLAYRKISYGVATNDANYITTFMENGKRIRCPYYRVWNHMIERCYSIKLHKKRPSYVGCSVCDEWLYFSNFKLWMEKQDFIGKDIDKDILFKGNKIYSPATCIFVTKAINSLFTGKKINSLNKIGSSFDRKNNTYRSTCRVNNKRVDLGCFKTENKAHEAYLKFKKAHVLKIAETQQEPIKSALIRLVS